MFGDRPYQTDIQGLFMPADADPPPDSRPISGRRNIASTELFGAETEVLISHNGEQYRLRITRQDKLILTK